MKFLTAAIVIALAAAALAVAEPANAGTTYSLYLSDLSATATQDSFVGSAFNGTEKASVSLVLAHDAALTTIDGGSITLKFMDKKVVLRQVTDAVSGGSLTATTTDSQLCLNQTFDVAASLAGAAGESAGSLGGTLTLFRTYLPGFGCWTFGGNLTGSVSLA